MRRRKTGSQWKDWWEFPGGKTEPGEEPADALRREIREELATEIAVGEQLCTVEYDYPKFHLSMQCFICTIQSGNLTLLEHEDARWLSYEELDSVRWLPADEEVIERLKRVAMAAEEIHEGLRRKEEGLRIKEEGRRRKDEGGRIKEEGLRRKD